ncbi:MAG: DNA-directed RNA polymerase subunit beta' [Patescibacteria group bacterium]|nr:DNA-directed RNA polymerase subunit beta' [Patescibacteria group bacterium]
MRVSDIKSIKIKLASPEQILSWSHGEVTKPETINYRTQKPEKDGLFCERIFGPQKDYECYCGKYKGIKYKGIVCDRCGVEVTKSLVRRERMGHIKLACPVSHIWFLRGVPSRIGLVLNIPMQKLERVIYFAAHIVTKVSEEGKERILQEIEKEYKLKIKAEKAKSLDKKELEKNLQELKNMKDSNRNDLLSLKPLKILSELKYHEISLKYGEIFEVGTGAEALQKILSETDFHKIIKELEKELEEDALKKEKKEEKAVLESKDKSKKDASKSLNKKLSEEEGRIKIIRRLNLIKEMLEAEIKPEWMFLTILPIIPPDLRPMVQLNGGRYASSDLNDLYRRVINRNNRLKYLLEINAPEVIVRNEKRMLQEAVDSLIDNGMRKGQTTMASSGGRRLLKSLSDMLKGKHGRFRQNLLGKRVDYSGRSIIVVGPHLKISQVGLPKEMALELFKPFIIKKILDREMAFNVRGASKLIEQETAEIWAILEEVVKDKFVLLNRAPTLHRLGIQAFKPILVEGDAIRVHPLVCEAFNADFDGDQMAVHLPISDNSQKEAKEIMLSSVNLLNPATGFPVVSPSKDVVLGCYWITRIKKSALGEGKIFNSKNEAILARDMEFIDLRAMIKVRMGNEIIETSVGRILFNNTLPDGYRFINEMVNSKKIKALLREIITFYNNKISIDTLDKIKELGFEYSTLSGITWGMDDLVIPIEKKNIIEQSEQKVEKMNKEYKEGLISEREKSNKSIEVWLKAKEDVGKLVSETLPHLGPVFSMVDSGARGSWVQVIQMAGMKGLAVNPAGRIIELPVKHCHKEGLDVLEYFISTHGARKGTVDTALKTSSAGYLTRKLVNVANEVVVNGEDCGDDEGIVVFRDDTEETEQNFVFKIFNRISLENIKGIVKKGEIIDYDKATEIIKQGIKQVRVRSSLKCKNKRGLCRKCYGSDLGNNQLVKLGEAVGVVAAQAIGEPGTQLTLRTFHTGGVAGGGDITQGLPRVEEIFECRNPKGKAIMSHLDGFVEEIIEGKIIKIKGQKLNSRNKETEEYKVPPSMAIWVKKGDKVKRGQQLCEGSLDLRELFRVAGIDLTQRYIVNEVQKIYATQGVNIHDKHVEIITRQMFSHIKIKKTGDSSFNIGEKIERAKFLEDNEQLAKKNKDVASGKMILEGISKISLTTDSFLSSASFQETSRVLIKAAIQGKEDELRGLKENVMIGKLIPVGTGFMAKEKNNLDDNGKKGNIKK